MNRKAASSLKSCNENNENHRNQARMKLHDEKSKQQVKERWKVWLVRFTSMVPWSMGYGKFYVSYGKKRMIWPLEVRAVSWDLYNEDLMREHGLVSHRTMWGFSADRKQEVNGAIVDSCVNFRLQIGQLVARCETTEKNSLIVQCGSVGSGKVDVSASFA